MKFNPSKCIHLAITRKKTHINHCYQIHNQQIQQNKSTKYLGVVIDKHLTWKERVNDICSKAIKAKAFLQRYNFSEIQLLYIPSETYTRICCYNMVPTPSILKTPNRKGSTQCSSFRYW